MDSYVPEVYAFHSGHLCPLASLNRRKIISLPGIPPEWIGRFGHAMVSRAALVQLIQEHHDELGLEPGGISDNPIALNQLLSNSDAPGYPTAYRIAVEYGQRIGYLLASLLLSEVGLTTPLHTWEAAYLDYWKTGITHIILGGGLINADLGIIAAAAAGDILKTCGVNRYAISPATHPSYLPLIGAACSLPNALASPALVLDFGGSAVKRGLALYSDQSTLTRLRLLSTIDIHPSIKQDSQALEKFILDVFTNSIQLCQLSGPIHAMINASIAAYIQDRQADLFDWGSDYTCLNQLNPKFKPWLSGGLAQNMGKPVTINFIHDGTAASRAFAGQNSSAVIMLGSAIGVGFVPGGTECRGISDQFTIAFE